MSRSATVAVLLRWFAALAGMAAVLGAMVSLMMPLALHVVDRTGSPITCGTGWQADPVKAVHEDTLNHQQHLLVGSQYVVSEYTEECATEVADRRWLAAGVAGAGGALALGALLAPYAVSNRPLRQRQTGADPDAGAFNSYATW